MFLRVLLALCISVAWSIRSDTAIAEKFDNRSYIKMPFLTYHQKHTKASHFYVSPSFNCQNRKGTKKYFVEFGTYLPTAEDFIHASRLVLMKLRETQFPIGCRLEVKEYDFINFKSHAIHKNKVIAVVEFSTYRPFLAPNKEGHTALINLVENQLGNKPVLNRAVKKQFFWAVSLRKVGGLEAFMGVGNTKEDAENDAIKKCKAGHRIQGFSTRCRVVARFSGDQNGCVFSINGSTRSGAADLNMFYSVTRDSNTCRKSRAVSSCNDAGAGKTGWDCRYSQTFNRNDALKLIWSDR